MFVGGSAALALAASTIVLPPVADAAREAVVHGGGHGGWHGGGHGGWHTGGTLPRLPRAGGGYGGHGGYGGGGGYYGVVRDLIQLTLGLCGPYAY